MRIDDDVHTPRLYRIAPGGAITSLAMHGAIAQPNRKFRPVRNGDVAFAGGPLVSDAFGGYFFLDDEATRNVFHLGPDGKVTKFAELPDPACCIKGLARNLETGELIIGGSTRIYKVTPDGAVSEFHLANYPSVWIRSIIIDDYKEDPTRP